MIVEIEPMEKKPGEEGKLEVKIVNSGPPRGVYAGYMLEFYMSGVFLTGFGFQTFPELVEAEKIFEFSYNMPSAEKILYLAQQHGIPEVSDVLAEGLVYAYVETGECIGRLTYRWPYRIPAEHLK